MKASITYLTLLLILALALTAPPASAQPLSYNYLEVGMEVGEYGSSDEAGVLLKGSIETAEGMRLLASYSIGSGDTPFGTYDYTDMELGMGSFMILSDTGTTMTGEWTMAYIRATNSNEFGSWSGDGYYLDIGMRNMLSPTMELNGGLRYRDMEGNNSRWLRVGMVLSSQPGRGITIDYTLSDQNNNPSLIRVGYRILF